MDVILVMLLVFCKSVKKISYIRLDWLLVVLKVLVNYDELRTGL